MTNTIIKKLNNYDKDKILYHFLNLDSDSLYKRFCFHIKEESLKTYVKNLDLNTNGIFGAYDSDLNIIGLGECILSEEGAEIGLSVIKEYQNTGLGSKLLKKTITFAKIKNKTQLKMNCLKTNKKVLHLAKKFGLSIVEHEDENLAIMSLENQHLTSEIIMNKLEDDFSFYLLNHLKSLNMLKDMQENINIFLYKTLKKL